MGVVASLGSLRVLKSRNYALLWWSGLASNAGTWMQTIAVGALITSLTDSAGWGGLVAAASFLSSGLCTPFGGVIADRHNRRRLLIIAGVLEALVAVALAALYLAGLVGPWVLVITVTVEGMLLGLYQPAASAMLPDLVDKAHLPDAAALSNASWNIGRTIGPALGGAVIAFGSYGAVFVINAVSCLLVAAAVYFIRLEPIEHDKSKTVLNGLTDGFRGARAEEGCWSAIKTIALVALCVSPFIALMPAMAQIVFDGNAVDTSHLVIAQGVGSVIGAIALAPLARRFGRRRLMLASLVAAPLVEMAYSQAPTMSFAILGAFFLGASYVGVLVGLSVIVQLRAPADLRGSRAFDQLHHAGSLLFRRCNPAGLDCGPGRRPHGPLRWAGYFAGGRGPYCPDQPAMAAIA